MAHIQIKAAKRRSLAYLLSMLMVTSVSEAAESDTAMLSNVEVEALDKVTELQRSPFTVSVIDASRFHGRSISLNDVLKRTAGVKLSQEGGLGSRATIAVHGLDGNRVRIFIDGHALNSPDGSFGINDVPIQLIDRIEIYKGVVPLRFGGDSLAGAVNVVTREFEGSWVDLSATFGSFDTQRLTAILTKELDNDIELAVGGFYNHSANNYRMALPQQDRYVERDHDDYLSYVIGTSATIYDRYFDKIKVELVNYRSQKELQGVEYRIKEARNESDAKLAEFELQKNNFLLDDLAFKYALVLMDLDSHFVDKATRCYNFNNTPRTCSGNGGEVGEYPRDSADNLQEVRQDFDISYSISPTNQFNVHHSHRASDFSPKDELASSVLGYDIGAFPSKLSTSVSAAGLQTAVFDNALVNDAGIKRYAYDYEISSSHRGLAGTPVRSDNADVFSGFYESLRYSPLQGLYVKASYEKSYRLPTTEEAFGNGTTITSSANIQPEQANNINLGLLLDRYNRFGLSWLNVEANWFRRDVRNMIKLQPTNLPGLSAYTNLGKIRAQGFELEFKTDINEQWYGYGAYTRQQVTDQMRYAIGAGRTLSPTYGLDVPNIAKQFASLGVEFKHSGLFVADSDLKLFWEVNWIDEFNHKWVFPGTSNRVIAAQTEHCAGFLYSLHKDQMHIGFDIKNLTDETLNDVYNLPLAGRSYHLTVRYSN